MIAKPEAIHRNLSILELRDPGLFAALVADRDVRRILVTTVGGRFFAVRRTDEALLLERLDSMGINPRRTGRWNR